MANLTQAERKKGRWNTVSLLQKAFFAETPEQSAALLKMNDYRRGIDSITEAEINAAYRPDPTVDRELFMRDFQAVYSSQIALLMITFLKYKNDNMGDIDTIAGANRDIWWKEYFRDDTPEKNRVDYPTYIRMADRAVAEKMGMLKEYEQFVKQIKITV